MHWQKIEIHKGRVTETEDEQVRLSLPRTGRLYSNAQLDDYSGRKRKDYLWHANTTMALEARFSHHQEKLQGTAGFGFWNAPFGDPNHPYPTLPKAIWFFFGSPPTDLPLNPSGHGRGWFANTLDATTWQAIQMAPLAPATLLLNHWPWFRHKIWPTIQKRLNISYQQLATIDMTNWHKYQIDWNKDGCHLMIDNVTVLKTTCRVQGPLGFVIWLDNQHMMVTPTGKMGAGVIQTSQDQWMEIRNVSVQKSV